MVSLPDNAVVARALDNLDPLIVIDFFLSETAERADVVLPGSVWCEDEGTTTNLEGRVIKINQAADTPAEAKRDWEIVCELAGRLGRGQFFGFHTSRDIFDELRRASKGGIADYAGITWEKIDRQSGVFWPCKAEDDPGTPHLITERFPHKDGLARFHPIVYTGRRRAKRNLSSTPHHRTRGVPLPGSAALVRAGLSHRRALVRHIRAVHAGAEGSSCAADQFRHPDRAHTCLPCASGRRISTAGPG